jgi:hypothetical protein
MTPPSQSLRRIEGHAEVNISIPRQLTDGLQVLASNRKQLSSKLAAPVLLPLLIPIYFTQDDAPYVSTIAEKEQLHQTHAPFNSVDQPSSAPNRPRSVFHLSSISAQSRRRTRLACSCGRPTALPSRSLQVHTSAIDWPLQACDVTNRKCLTLGPSRLLLYIWCFFDPGSVCRSHKPSTRAALPNSRLRICKLEHAAEKNG